MKKRLTPEQEQRQLELSKAGNPIYLLSKKTTPEHKNIPVKYPRPKLTEAQRAETREQSKRESVGAKVTRSATDNELQDKADTTEHYLKQRGPRRQDDNNG